MEFLVEFEVIVPDATPESEVKVRERAAASVAAKLVDEGHLVPVWRRPVASGETKILGVCDRLNRGVFISAAGRQAPGVIEQSYLVA
jgi:muconolactone delta-isomerase